MTFLRSALFLLLFVPVALAQSALQFVPLGYQQITSLSASTGLTVPAGATSAVIIAEAQAVRWRDDGVAPTSSVGMPMAVNVPLSYSGTLTQLHFIEQTSGAKLNITYYR